MCDASSIAGGKAINESDMPLMPDRDSLTFDPFAAQTTAVLFCDVLNPGEGTPYNRCPRGIAKAAQAYIKSAKIADTAFFGPEAEFFVFDDVRYKTSMNETFVYMDDVEGAYNSGKVYEGGNLALPTPTQGATSP